MPSDTVESMATITIERKPNSKRVTVEIDAERLERLAASLGLFSPDFLKSLSRSEKDIALGKTKRLRSLRELRRR
jgi:hypothetical protein